MDGGLDRGFFLDGADGEVEYGEMLMVGEEYRIADVNGFWNYADKRDRRLKGIKGFRRLGRFRCKYNLLRLLAEPSVFV
jgi:hypothetical protein